MHFKISSSQKSRLIRLVSSILLLMIVLSLLQGQQHLEQRGISQQAREITRALLDQAASTASRLVIEQDETTLSIMATRLSQHPAIHDVAIYDSHGNLMATNSSYQTLQERLPTLISQIPEQRLEARVATIYHDGNPVGFIQMTLSYESLTAESQALTETIQSRNRLALLLTLVAGFLLGNSLSTTVRATSRHKLRKQS